MTSGLLSKKKTLDHCDLTARYFINNALERVYVRCKTVTTCALCRTLVSSSIVSGGIIQCFALFYSL